MATLLVATGRAIVTNRLNGGGTTPSYVAWGTGAGTTSQVTTSVTNDTLQVVGTQTAGGTLAITNAGLFDASTAGNLFVKGDFTGIALNSGDSIQFTFRCQFS